MSKHAAPSTSKSITADLHEGFMEGFGYWDRNGKHRAVEAFNPMTGITTRINDKAAA